MIYIGIDTGVHTGFAVYDSELKMLREVTCLKIHQAMEAVIDWQRFTKETDKKLFLRFEDARKRTWFGTHSAREDRARLQGAGSVKRDCQIWEEFLDDIGVIYEKVAPRHNMTKMSAASFKSLTHWTKRTNEHGRDAAMLVYGF